MSAWRDTSLAMRLEAHFGDRVVRCYGNRPTTLTRMLAEAVARNPHGEALAQGARRLSWSDVDRQVSHLAAALRTRGLQRGQRIALFLENCIEFPLTLFAAARIGAIAVPIGHRCQEPEVRYMLTHSAATHLVYSASLLAQVPAAGATPDLQQRICVGDCDAAESFHAMLQSEKASAPANEAVGEEDVALIMYTSGTTGHPKGAMVTHMNVIHAAMTYEFCMGLTMKERSVICVPMSHITGIAAMIATALRCASTLIVAPPFKAGDFLALAVREGMTHTVMVPAMYNLCVRQAGFDWRSLAQWRVGGYGGAPMPPATIELLAQLMPQLGLMNCYGATETVVPVAVMPPDETPLYPDRVGRAVPCADILFSNPQGAQVPTGEHGELWVSAPTVVRGYWRDPEATARAFTAGYWHSGDVGSISAAGHVGIHDRIKDMINRGGYKIFTTEVENVICEFPAVRECAVVGKPCPVLGERVHAFISTAEATVDGQQLRAFCAGRLADYKVPESFTFLNQPLPRNANGKVMKRELREQAARSDVLH